MIEFNLNQEFEDLVNQRIGDQQTIVMEEKNNMTNIDESAKSRDFFQDNNAIK